MAETAKKTTPKKTAPKKKTTPKVPETEAAPKTSSKTYDLNTLIPCKSVRQNDLIYRASTNGMKYVWKGFGDVREIPYQEIMSMRASRSRFLYEPWLVIEDEDLMARPEFERDFGELYRLYEEFEDPRKFFEQDAATIRSKLENVPKGLRDLIVYNAGQYIQDGSLDRISVVNVIDEVLGTNLRMMM